MPSDRLPKVMSLATATARSSSHGHGIMHVPKQVPDQQIQVFPGKEQASPLIKCIERLSEKGLSGTISVQLTLLSRPYY
tara:strand:- start:38 stop:274 length:237 start_codon:yes stop_codon:yes gene_type:complete